MSSLGVQSAALMAARREELRLSEVRRQCESVRAACHAAVAEIRDEVLQQVVAGEVSALVASIDAAPVSAQPDAALKVLTTAQQQLERTLVTGRRGAETWREQELDTRARLASLDRQASDDPTTRAAHEQLARGDVAGAMQSVTRAEAARDAAAKAAFDERVRREVVTSLVRTLQSLGFTVPNPTRALEAGSDVVHVHGQMPSGRRATFTIDPSGSLEFDFDGYEGRGCAKDMERVETELRDRYGVVLGPKQVTWRAPDRISKGALPLPNSNTRPRGSK